MYEEEVMEVFKDYFDKVYSSSMPTDMEQILKAVECKATAEKNSLMLQDITSEDIRTILDQMHSDKAPGPEGMIVCFYKKYWAIVGTDVVRLSEVF